MIRSFIGAALVAAVSLVSACAPESADTDQLDFVATNVEQQGLTTLLALADTHVRGATPFTTYGSTTTLAVGLSTSRAKSFVLFHPAEIAGALQNRQLVSATIELRLSEPTANVGSSQGVVARPLTRPFFEASSTYACAQDSAPTNTVNNCTAANTWSLESAPFAWQSTGIPVLTGNGTTGIVSLDVTADIANVQAGTWTPIGWVVMRSQDANKGDFTFHSRETTKGPKLVIVTEPLPAVCGDGVVNGDEDCDDDNAIETDGCFSDCTRAETFTAVTDADYSGPAGATKPFMMQRPDGRVVITQGFGAMSWDPQTTVWQQHFSPLFLGFVCAARLGDGRILVSGNGGGQAAGAEIFNPATLTWVTTTAPSSTRTSPSCASLPDGRALYVGGTNTSGIAAEVFNPTTLQWTAQAWSGTQPYDTRALPLANGKRLFADGSPVLFNPATMTPAAATSGLTPIGDAAAVVMNDGRVLMVGAVGASIFNPTSETWSPAAPQPVGRNSASLVVLPSGHVLATGGRTSAGVALATSAVYNPNVDAWSTSSPLNVARYEHGSLALADGRVLIVNGVETASPVAEVLTFTP